MSSFTIVKTNNGIPVEEITIDGVLVGKASFVTSGGKLLPFTEMFDEEGNETKDQSKAVTVICTLEDQPLTINLEGFEQFMVQ